MKDHRSLYNPRKYLPLILLSDVGIIIFGGIVFLLAGRINHVPAWILLVSGIISIIFGLAIILGSLWALIPAGNIAVLFIIRTFREDNTLTREFPGYQESVRKVRFRLIPYIW